MSIRSMLCAELHCAQKPVLSNWRKTGEKLGFTRSVVNDLQSLLWSLQQHDSISHVWIDYQLLDQHNAIQDFLSVETTIATVSKITNNNLGLVLVVPHNIRAHQLTGLVNQSQCSVVVDSDLKIKHIFESCISSILLDKIYHSPSVNHLLCERAALFSRQPQPKTHITWLIPSVNRTVTTDIIQNLTIHFRLRVNTFENMRSLLKNLATPAYCTDMIFVDADLVMDQCVSDIDVVQCLNTANMIAGAAKPFKVFIAVKQGCSIEHIRQLMQNPGVAGFVPIVSHGFDYQDLQTAVCQLLSGSYHIPTAVKQRLDANKSKVQDQSLSVRQTEILKLIVHQGASNKVIANRLKITEGAVKSHVSKLLKKYGLRNRTELAALCH